MEYPARRNDTAKAQPTFPAPTIAIRGFAAMPGRIAESGSSLRVSAAPHRRAEAMLYIGFHAESPTLFFTPKKSAHRKAQRKARIISSRVVYRGPVFWVTT